MAQFAMLTLGRDSEYEACQNLDDAKRAAKDYYRMQGDDAEEAVICVFEDNQLLKAWEKNNNYKWVVITNSSCLQQIQQRLTVTEN